MTTGCDEQRRIALGAYVLGALDAAERTDVERHLAECAPCRDELAELAGLPGLLGKVPEEELADAPRPAPALLERTLRRLRARRIRVRRALGAVAAALVLVAGGVVAAVTVGGGGAAVTASATHGPVHASAALTPHDWGTAIELTVSGVPSGDHCRMEVAASDGSHETIGSWRAGYHGDGEIRVHASTDISRADLRTVSISNAEGTGLVTIPIPGT